MPLAWSMGFFFLDLVDTTQTHTHMNTQNIEAGGGRVETTFKICLSECCRLSLS